MAESHLSTLREVQEMTGFLIDLDGTIYDPVALLPGAKAFYRWLVANNKSFVFLSNTGCKGGNAVQRKFLQTAYRLSDDPIPLNHFYTATEAAVDYLVHHVPADGSIYVIQGETTLHGDPIELLRRPVEQGGLASTVEFFSSHGTNGTTKLTEADARRLAHKAKVSLQSGRSKVYVLFAHDGPLDDPDTPEVEDWNSEVFRYSHWLVTNGGVFVNTAGDVTNSAPRNPQYPDIEFSTPGPGAFEAMVKALTFPKAKDRWVNVGKGGKEGNEYIMMKGVELLKQQNHSGDLSKIVMIGDRLDTDMKGGQGIGVNTLFLCESGAHSKEDIPYFGILPKWILPGLVVFEEENKL